MKKIYAGKKYLWIVILLIVLFMQVMMLVIAGQNKQGFFVDELWGYGLANSYYHPHVYSDDAFNGEYLSPEYFKSYLEVSEDDAFKYGSVFYNQSQDAHPPLFYCVLHTISSVFLNTFSKWYGIIPNIICFIVTAICMYAVAKKIIKNCYIAIIPVVLWGFSTQTVSYTILVRMYMMFAMFVMLNIVIHSGYLQDNNGWTRKQYVLLILVNIGGFLTQYYYYIFAFFLSLFTVGVMIFRKQWKQFIIYSASMLVSVAIAIFIFPGIINTFLTNRGAEAVNNLLSDKSWLESFAQYYDNIMDKLLYGINKGLLFVALMGFVLFVCFGIKNNLDTKLKDILKRINCFVPSLLFSSFFYMIFIIKIAPFIVDRYYYPIVPIFWIVIVYLTVVGMRNLKYGIKIACVLLLVFGAAATIQGYQTNKIMYLFPYQAEVMRKIKNFEGSSCVYITDGREYTAVVHALEFEHFSEIKVIDVSKTSLLDCEIHNQKEDMIVYIDERLNQQETISQIMEKTGYTQCAELGRGSGVWWEDAEEIYIYAFR